VNRHGAMIAWLAPVVLATTVLAADVVNLVKSGNTAFKQQKYVEALQQYQLAETERPESPELDYNIAGVLYNQQKYEEAIQRYTKALNTPDAAMNPRVQYNLGNTYYKMGDFQKAITSFQKALEADPSDLEAKFNLELARKMLKENIKPDSEGQDQQNQQQQQQQQQDSTQQDKQQQPQPDQQQGQQKDQPDQQKQQDQQVQQKPISKEDAERILNALKDDEQDVQKKIKREVMGGDYNGNDW
jgi:Ca-activated chloride channel homolog